MIRSALLWHSFPPTVDDAESVLSQSVSLSGGFKAPACAISLIDPEKGEQKAHACDIACFRQPSGKIIRLCCCVAMRSVPNLFRTLGNRHEIERYYSVYLVQLLRTNRARRAIEACRCIRRFAKNQGRPKTALFTFQWEIDAYERGRLNAPAMWRVLRSWDRMALGKPIDFANHRWKPEDAHRLLFFYAPILYLRERYQLGCELLERAIKMHARRQGWGFELLWHIYKPAVRPATTYDVTLTHFYRALGRDLRQWELWGDFVDDFPAKLFRLSRVNRNSLRNDPKFLKPFFEWICAERKRRLFTHTTMGVIDLLDSPAKVKQRQTATAKKIARLADDPHRKELEEKITKTFPELAEI